RPRRRRDAAHRAARRRRGGEHRALGCGDLDRPRARVLHKPSRRVLRDHARVRRLRGRSLGEGSSRRMNILELDFMRNAFVAGGCIAVAAGLVGYFVVLRNQVFTADALGHVAFTGSLGGVLAGLNLLVSAFASCIAVALAIGTLGGRGRGRDVAIGTVFAWVLGVGVLFLSLYTTSRSATSGAVGVSVLFGSILSLQPQQVVVSSAAALATCAVVAIV